MSGRTDAPAAWRSAIDQAGVDLPEALRNPAFFEAEYAMVVLPNRITDRDGYLRVRRPGRGVRLNRAQRTAVWSVVESYRLAARASRAPSTSGRRRRWPLRIWTGRPMTVSGRWFDHVLVDEGQDLSPAQWQLIRALTGEGPNDVFIAEDSHQRIYGHRITLSHFGLRIIGRSRRLTLNYRTTAENLGVRRPAARGRGLPGSGGRDGGPLDVPLGAQRAGAEGRCVPVATAELDHAAQLISGWVEAADAIGAPRRTIAVLVRDRFQRDRVVTGLAERGVTIRGVERETASMHEPVVMTMHRAKGTEFYKVLLFGVSNASVPKGLDAFNHSEDDRADALLRERSLLYVAATRARDELVVSWSKSPSPLLPAQV